MLTVEFDAKIIELVKNPEPDVILKTFSEGLDMLKEAVYNRAADEITDSQLTDTLYYTSLVIGLTLAAMGFEAEGLSKDFNERTKNYEALINEE